MRNIIIRGEVSGHLGVDAHKVDTLHADISELKERSRTQT